VARVEARGTPALLPFLRLICTLTVLFSALLLWSADRADAHATHGMVATAATPLAAAAGAHVEGAVSGNADFGSASNLVSGSLWSDCDRDCCSGAYCSSALIVPAQVAVLHLDPQRLVVIPPPLTAISTSLEGLRRPPRHLI